MHDLSNKSAQDSLCAPAWNLPAKDDDDIAIRLRDVRKEYRLYDSLSDQALDVLGMSWLRFWRDAKYKIFAALDGIDLDIKKGERIGIVGRNGAGKTTLLKLITGNFAPTSGEIDVNGNVQALMQTGLGFHGDFTGMENIRSALAYSGLPFEEVEAAIEDVIDFCELGDFINQPLKAYSLGMRSRLQFAVSTAINPDIVIIDEVLGAGDAYFAGKSAARMKRLTESGATLLIVSHSMQQILQFSSKAIWMEQGEIVHHGPPLEVVNFYEEFIYSIEENSKKERNNTVSIPPWIQSRVLGKEVKGSDWGGDGPIFIESIDVVDCERKVANKLTTEQPYAFRATVKTNELGSYKCACLFIVYDEAGEVVCRVLEPQTVYEFDDEHKVVECWIDRNPIGQGKYILSAGLYRDLDLGKPNLAHRYHILSRGCSFSIVSPSRNDAKVVVIDPNWKLL